MGDPIVPGNDSSTKNLEVEGLHLKFSPRETFDPLSIPIVNRRTGLSPSDLHPEA